MAAFVCWIVDGGERGRWCGVSGLYVGLSMVENVADVGWLMVEGGWVEDGVYLITTEAWAMDGMWWHVVMACMLSGGVCGNGWGCRYVCGCSACGGVV